jgi:hypothetical protein
MKKILITVAAAAMILGGAIAAHSAADPGTQGPAWVNPDGTEKSLVPAWDAVLGDSGSVVGFTPHDSDADVMPVYDAPNGTLIGTETETGFTRTAGR